MHLQYLIHNQKSLVKTKLLRSFHWAVQKQQVTGTHCSMIDSFQSEKQQQPPPPM